MSSKRKLRLVLYLGLAVLLILCLFSMPYGYYQMVRFLSMVAFAYLAYLEFQSRNIDRMVVFIALAILFQPLAPISLGRFIWILVDVLVAGYLLYLSYRTSMRSVR